MKNGRFVANVEVKRKGNGRLGTKGLPLLVASAGNRGEIQFMFNCNGIVKTIQI